MIQPPDILLLNANTDAAMTDRMVAAARALHPQVQGATVTRGAAYISDEAAADIAAGATVDFAHGLTPENTPDALVICCFGDPGLWEVRALLPVPVIGMAEASCHAACQLGRRFAIVTGGAAWGPMLARFVADLGLGTRLSGIHILELTGDRIAADRDAAQAEIGRAAAEAADGGADVVILGGAGLIGFADELQSDSPVPLLDSLNCAVTQAVAMGTLQHATR
ncbi:MAG: aspartate/glutamate racemase family protein [Pseudomonadota bacterium]